MSRLVGKLRQCLHSFSHISRFYRSSLRNQPIFSRFSHFATLTICVAVADSSVSIPFSGCPKTSSAPLLLLPPHVSLFSLPLKLLPPFPTSLSRHCSGWISCPSVGADSIPPDS